MQKKIIITIPAYNEEKSIGKVIQNIKKNLFEKGLNYEILVVDDGSNDNTYEVAKIAGADYVIRHSVNSGVGTTFRTALKAALEAGADIIVNIDADGQFSPADIPKLIEPILSGKADFVTATRFVSGYPENMSFIKRVGNKLFTWVVNNIMRSKFTDTQCGFRALSRDCAIDLVLFGKFTYTQEMFLFLTSRGYTVIEIPVSVHYFKDRKSRVVKNPIHYGIKALSIILASFADYRPLLLYGLISILLLLYSAITFLFKKPIIIFQIFLFEGSSFYFILLAIISLCFGILGHKNYFVRQDYLDKLKTLKIKKYAKYTPPPNYVEPTTYISHSRFFIQLGIFLTTISLILNIINLQIISLFLYFKNLILFMGIFFILFGIYYSSIYRLNVIKYEIKKLKGIHEQNEKLYK